jgi:hypothetical protein
LPWCRSAASAMTQFVGGGLRPLWRVKNPMPLSRIFLGCENAIVQELLKPDEALLDRNPVLGHPMESTPASRRAPPRSLPALRVRIVLSTRVQATGLVAGEVESE